MHHFPNTPNNYPKVYGRQSGGKKALGCRAKHMYPHFPIIPGVFSLLVCVSRMGPLAGSVPLISRAPGRGMLWLTRGPA